MLCPKCNDSMEKVNKENVKIDVCKHCKGVWLDSGELEQIIQNLSHYPAEYRSSSRSHREYDDYRYEEKYHKKYSKQHIILKILKEIFD